ncbi:hypothetical protein A5674_22150 [Mycobacterium malmoense]|uniref:hypothetical protein n=1 Tax=Mycobacterium malmoense TaxID=1780 RepID=UPI00080B6F46|nr:hypothetical protein [Mycobacterium malmoense]OCB25007.1 hypothetical protein A5674_22150 [Mycobacterium malmoense]
MSEAKADNKTREERRREVIAQQLGEFPRELARCTCDTPSFNRDDHANTCPLGPTKTLSSDRRRSPTYDLPELQF